MKMLPCMSAHGGVAWPFLVQDTCFPRLWLILWAPWGWLVTPWGPPNKVLPPMWLLIHDSTVSSSWFLVGNITSHCLTQCLCLPSLQYSVTWHWWWFHLCCQLASSDLTYIYLVKRKSPQFSLFMPSLPSAFCLPPVVQGLTIKFSD